MTKAQKFKKEYAFELLKIAEGDLETAEVLFQASKGRKENVCFNAQQVIEKSIKAVLCFKEQPVPFTHNIDILLDRLINEKEFEKLPDLNELSDYATIRRYEEGTFELDTDDLKAAIDSAKIVFSIAKRIINKQP